MLKKELYIDIEKLMEFVVNPTNGEQNITTMISEQYPIINGDINDDNGTKETSESKITFNEVSANIRYDLIKQFLSPLISTYDLTEDSKKLCIYTLKKSGIMLEK